MSDPYFVSHSITWLADDAGPRRYNGGADLPRGPSTMPGDVGTGSFETMCVKPGLAIAQATHEFLPERSGQMIALAETDLTLSEPALAIQSAAAGRAIVNDRTSKNELVLAPDRSIIQRQSRVEFSRLHDASQSNDLFFLLVSESVLCEFLGEGNMQKFLTAQKIMNTPAARGMSIPRSISAVLHSAMTTHLTGNLRKLYAQGKVLEYLSLLLNFTCGDSEPASCPHRTRLIRQAHEELISLKGDVPKLSDLSKKYGLSARTLNNDFKKEFGNSIYAYIKDQRLSEAHKALEETETPIKVIAANVGYAHVTNFMLAFKKKYGYPPGSLRR